MTYDKKQQNISNNKTQQKFNQQISEKKELYRFRHRVTASGDVIFICPLTFCICSMSLFSKGTNSH